MNKILITGGAGFIGSKIIYRILNNSQKSKIIVLDNFLEQVHGNTPYSKIPGVKYIKGDVSNAKDWKRAFEFNPEIIIHLAAETGTGQSMHEISRYVRTNVIGTSNMLDILNNKNHNVKKVILSSSRSIYGEHENLESTIPSPLSVYALTKLDQEKLLELSCPIPYTIFRYQNVYGPGQSILNPYTGIISIFSEKLYADNDVEIWDNGIPTRDFIFVEDIVSATLLALENKKSDYKIYNVGSGVSTKVLEIAEKLKYLLKSESQIKIIEYHRAGDIMHASANIEKIKDELGWKPNQDIDSGLHSYVEWFKSLKKNSNYH